MTEALRAAGFAVTAAMAAFALRAAHRQAGAAVALAAGLMLFFFAVSYLSGAAEAMKSLSRKSGIGEESVKLMLKLLSIAYLSEFSAQVCRDAGEDGLAAKAALCGKTLLLAQTLPLILEIGELALTLTP